MKTIIDMAENFGTVQDDCTIVFYREELKAFAELVRAEERRACERHFQIAMRNAVTAEREECAKVCEELAETNWADNEQCAAVIRARNNL